MIAEIIILGKVFTSDNDALYAEGFAVSDGKIVAVGSKKDILAYKGANTEVKEYKEGIILPGFTEGHAHVSSTIELTMGPYLGRCESIEECQQVIEKFAKEHPGDTPIMGGGFDPGLFGPEGPTAEVIDEVVVDRAVMISDEGHHSIWVNKKTLEIAGITKDTPDPESGQICHYENGEPSGFLQEMAIDLITPAMPQITVEDYKNAILYYQEIGLSNGIVTAFEPMLSHTGDEDMRMEAYTELEQEGKLKIAFCVAQTLTPGADMDAFFKTMKDYHEKFADKDKLQVNTVKFFMDGVVDGHTALLRDPYKLEPCDCGPLMVSQEELNQGVVRSFREDYNIHVHAIGDAAIDEALNAIEYGIKEVPDAVNRRNAITHLQVCQEDHPDRMKKLGVVAVVNPYWFFKTPLYEPLERPFLGDERAERMYYLKSFLDAGIPMSQASDFPVTVPPDTMFCLHMMLNRMDPKLSKEPYYPQECIGIEEALKVLTIGGAYENFMDEAKGSITVGKDADFVIIDQDVTEMSVQNIYKSKVKETWIGGEMVYTC